MSTVRRMFVLSTALLVVGILPPSALGGATGGLRLNGKGTGVASSNTSNGTVTVSGVGRISHLGQVVVLANDTLTPQGAGPTLPYALTGTETVLLANGDQLFGAVTGTGVNKSGATSGTNVVTITGGTGGLAGATVSYTETYTGHIFSLVGPSLVGPIHTVVRGQLTLGGGYCDPLQGPMGYCDPLQGSSARDHSTGKAHHQHRRHRNGTHK